MKRFTALVIVFFIALCSLSACSKGTYEDGYEDGYNDGYSDAEFEMECLFEEEFLDGYDIGYDDGYDEGCEEVHSAIDEAEHYARSKTGLSVYEAWNNISIYHDGVDPCGHPLPTKKEYLLSIETLVLFTEHLDNTGLVG